MATQENPQHPYAGVDLAGMDAGLPSLLAQVSGESLDGSPVPERNLSARESLLFRFGLLVGLAEWDLAGETLGTLLDTGLLTGPEMERAAAEAGLVRGLPACRHLQAPFEARGLHAPSSVAEAERLCRAAPGLSSAEGATTSVGLTVREVSVLGLGITWGARCWDT